MLTLFVVDSIGGPRFDDIKAIKSFGEIVETVKRVENYAEINETEKTTDWYGIIYDNECIEPQLQAALETFFKISDADVLKVYKRIQVNGKPKVFRSLRFFKNHVKLQETSLLPTVDNLKIETILNGWVLEDSTKGVPRK